MALSRERIASELLKLLSYPTPVAAVRLMLARDILKPILPEIVAADALEMLVNREDSSGDPIRRFAALVGPNPAVARDIATRLKLSKAQSKKLVTACGWTIAYKTVPALAYRLGTESARDRLLLAGADATALENWQRPTLPITGGTLITRGLAPGPIVAQTLIDIENAWIEAGFPLGEGFDAILGQLNPLSSPKTASQI